MNKTRLIRITKNRIFLTPEMSLSLSQTSLLGEHLSFRTFEDIFLEIEINRYEKDSKKLSVEIIDYQPSNFEKFQEQKAKAQVSFIQFKPLKWQKIEKHLSSYTKAVLLREKIVIDDAPLLSDSLAEKSFSSANESNKRHNNENSILHISDIKQIYPPQEQRTPIIEKIKEEGKIHFKNADFNLGFVAFTYKSINLNETFNLKIENTYLLKEFNTIKSYFPKVYGGNKQFSITIYFTVVDKVVQDITTTSPEIENINENILDIIKRERVANLTSTPLRNSVNKSLFTAEDIFDSFEDTSDNSNIFKQSEEDILNFIIDTKNVRNAKHLQFLSGSKHSIKQKIRFSLKPLFGFVFFIEGETKNHFCWELLDSHATYLWSFDKINTDAIFQFKRIEETINIIKKIGREAYKRDYKNNNIDNDLNFSTIEHNNINSASKDGFVEWKNRLMERLV